MYKSIKHVYTIGILKSTLSKLVILTVGSILVFAPMTAAAFGGDGMVSSQSAQFVDPNPQSGDEFGYSLATSSDASIAVVGAPNETDPSSGTILTGAAYIFVNQSGSWTEVAQLSPSDMTEYHRFGTSVAISSDGSEVVVGSPIITDGSSPSGSADAYVFTEPAGGWTSLNGATVNQNDELYASDQQTTAEYGESVAISGDGSTIAVGAPLQNASMSQTQTGEAYLYNDTYGPGWNNTVDLVQPQSATVVASTPVNNGFFGSSLALSNNGSTFAVGQPGSVQQGSAYIYQQSGGWTGSISSGGSFVQSNDDGTCGGNVQCDFFGSSVSIDSGGDEVVIGASNATSTQQGAANQGEAYVFASNGTGGWNQSATDLYPSDGATGDDFGFSVNMSSDGSTILVGAPNHLVNINGVNVESAGASYAFTNEGSNTWSQTNELVPSPTDTGLNFGWAGYLVDDETSAVIGAPNLAASSGSDSVDLASLGNASPSVEKLVQQASRDELATSASKKVCVPIVNGTAFSFNTSATTGGNTQTSLANAPCITKVNKSTQEIGKTVTITGVNLSSPTSVTLNGVPVTVNSSSATSIVVTLPNNSTSGHLLVTTATGNAETPTKLTITPPSITSIKATSGTVGSQVVVKGKNLAGVTNAYFNESGGKTVAATISAGQTDTSLTVTVPMGAITGPITLVSPVATVHSATYTVH